MGYMEKFKLVSAEKSPVKKQPENFPELMDEFKPLEAPSASAEELEASVASDKKEAQDLLEKLKAATPPPTPHEAEMSKKRTKSVETSALRADERNSHRKWWEKLFGRGRVTAEDMEREEAEAMYVKISNLKKNPNFYGNRHQGPEYNTMANAMRQGASESELSQVAAETNAANQPTWEPSFAQYDAQNVEWEKERRREQGLPTDILNRDIEFSQAQKWEQEQRKRNENESGKEKKAA